MTAEYTLNDLIAVNEFRQLLLILSEPSLQDLTYMVPKIWKSGIP
jgi:hypothetical protein